MLDKNNDKINYLYSPSNIHLLSFFKVFRKRKLFLLTAFQLHSTGLYIHWKILEIHWTGEC